MKTFEENPTVLRILARIESTQTLGVGASHVSWRLVSRGNAMAATKMILAGVLEEVCLADR